MYSSPLYLCASYVLSYTMYPSPLSLCTFYHPLLYHVPISPISVYLLSSSPIPCTPLPYLCVPAIILSYTMYPSPLSLCAFYRPLLYLVILFPISVCLLSSSPIPCTPLPYLCVPSITISYTMYLSPLSLCTFYRPLLYHVPLSTISVCLLSSSPIPYTPLPYLCVPSITISYTMYLSPLSLCTFYRPLLYHVPLSTISVYLLSSSPIPYTPLPYLCVPSITLSYTMYPSPLSLCAFYRPLLYHVPFFPISVCLLSSSPIPCTPLPYLCVPSITLSYTMYPSSLSLCACYRPLLYHVPLSPISVCLLSPSPIPCTPLPYLCVPSITLSYTMYPSPLSLCAFYRPLLYHVPLSPISVCLLSPSPIPCTSLPYLCVPSTVLSYTMYPSPLSLCAFYRPLLYHVPLSTISVYLLSSSPIPCTPLHYLCVPSIVLSYTIYPSPLSLCAFYHPLLYHVPLSTISVCLLSSSPIPCTLLPYLCVPAIVLSYTMYPSPLSLCAFYHPLLYHVPLSTISVCLLSPSPIPCTSLSPVSVYLLSSSPIPCTPPPISV